MIIFWYAEKLTAAFKLLNVFIHVYVYSNGITHTYKISTLQWIQLYMHGCYKNFLANSESVFCEQKTFHSHYHLCEFAFTEYSTMLSYHAIKPVSVGAAHWLAG